jgi:hypothetical protein
MSIASVVRTILSAVLLLVGPVSLVVGFLAVSSRSIRERLPIASPLSLVQLESVVFFLGWATFIVSRILSASHA